MAILEQNKSDDESLLSEQVNKVEFDKFMEGDIITFKEGISREVSCSASQSIPVADINIKVAGRDRTQINQHTEVNNSMKAE